MCVCVFAHTSECLSLCECECVNLMCSALYKEAKAGPVTFSTKNCIMGHEIEFGNIDSLKCHLVICSEKHHF